MSLADREITRIALPSVFAIARQDARNPAPIALRIPLLLFFPDFRAIAGYPKSGQYGREQGAPSNFYDDRNDHRTATMFCAHPTSDSLAHNLCKLMGAIHSFAHRFS